jgi:hypothetical protein
VLRFHTHHFVLRLQSYGRNLFQRCAESAKSCAESAKTPVFSRFS